MIVFENLTKKYWKFTAVDNLNLQIKDWEVFGLLGRNWAGKTTTIKMLTWLLKPTKWKILFDWISIYEKPIQIKKQISYIADTPYVYEKLTGIEFLEFIWSLWWMTKKEVEKKSLPFIKLFNLEEVITKKSEEFSHWMRQKLVFTAALIHNPKYLIVDEPMVWLDPQSAKAVKKIFRILAQKWSTVIITTHQLSVAQEVCDRIGIIHHWKLQALFEDKKDFENKLEDKFIQITGWYDEKIIEETLNF